MLTELEIDASTVTCYDTIEVKKTSIGRKKYDDAGHFTSCTLQKRKGGGVMSDYEMLSLVCVIISLVLIAIDLGRNIGNPNKK